MLTLFEIKSAIDRTRKPLTEIAKETGVHYNTLRNIYSGTITNPKLDTVQKISDFFEKEDKKNDNNNPA